MDAGTAAVLGALAGSVATIGAALATGWAQREGARITARSEHRRERRQPRHDVYKEFISVLEPMRLTAAVFVTDAEYRPQGLDAQLVAGWCELSDAMAQRAIAAALAGPKSIARSAMEIHQLANKLAINLRSLEHCEALEDSSANQLSIALRRLILIEAQKFGTSAERFVFTAQSALDDDGSRK